MGWTLIFLVIIITFKQQYKAKCTTILLSLVWLLYVIVSVNVAFWVLINCCGVLLPVICRHRPTVAPSPKCLGLLICPLMLTSSLYFVLDFLCFSSCGVMYGIGWFSWLFLANFHVNYDVVGLMLIISMNRRHNFSANFAGHRPILSNSLPTNRNTFSYSISFVIKTSKTCTVENGEEKFSCEI